MFRLEHDLQLNLDLLFPILHPLLFAKWISPRMTYLVFSIRVGSSGNDSERVICFTLKSSFAWQHFRYHLSVWFLE